MTEQVLIVGAGPTGLVLALWLTKQGIPVRIIDKSVDAGETSRAMAVHARTLELYQQLDLGDVVAAAGHQDLAINFWSGGKKRAHLSFGTAGEHITPYPFLLIYPQDEHERLLVKHLAAMGVFVERQTEMLSFQQKHDQVTARLQLPDGSDELVNAAYLAGCDGVHSTVRNQTGDSFKGGTYKQIFYVADVRLNGLNPADEAHIAIDGDDFVIVLPYGDNGLYRIIGTMSDDPIIRNKPLSFNDISHATLDRMNITISHTNWFSHYKVHHRITDRFRHDRVFLLGDAAHIHSPAGGQGMNTGIGDAINLAWKLAEVMHNKAPDSLLDSYETERHAFARRIVDTTDRLFSLATAEGNLANFIRSYLFPIIASTAYELASVRELLFRTVSQIVLNYHDSPISEGKAAHIKGGDRLPWVSAQGEDNYESLRNIAWQMHVYGDVRPDIAAWCDRHWVHLHVFTYMPEHQTAGFVRDAAYLLRPDTYVAFACAEQSVAALDQYVSARGYPLKAGRFNS